MPKVKAKGPPYLKIPDERYVVVIKPWGVNSAGGRTQRNVDVLGAWMRAVFGFDKNRMQVECVYMMSTRDEVIVRLSDYVNIVPGLGSHKWSKFLNPRSLRGSEGQNESKIFEYNWTRNGDPATHNWEEWYPTPELPPKDFPVVLPYPKPSYAVRPMADERLKNLILALPAERQPTPEPPAPVEDDELVGGFRPYQPPEHHPSHHLSQYADPALNPPDEDTDAKSDVKPDIKPSIKSELDEFSRLNKPDPYEEEENALQLLQDLTDIRQRNIAKKEEVKEESLPSAELADTLAQYEAGVRDSVKMENGEKIPSTSLTNALNTLIQSRRSTSPRSIQRPRSPSAKVERDNSPPAAAFLDVISQKARADADSVLRTSGNSSKRPKLEDETDDFSSDRYNRNVRVKLENRA